MRNFKYCLWYLPKLGHRWYSLTAGFSPHLSIATDLTLEKVKNLRRSIKNQEIQILLDKEIHFSTEEEFYAAYYNIFCSDPPVWWPMNPHISFLYQYTPFNLQQIENLEKNLIIKSATLDTFKIMKCSGHFSTWEEHI